MRLPRFYPILDTEAALGRGIDPVHAVTFGLAELEPGIEAVT